MHQVKVKTGLIVLILFSTENRRTRRSYLQEEHNDYKVEKGSHCSGTEGTALIVYMLHNVSSKNNHPCKTIWPNTRVLSLSRDFPSRISPISVIKIPTI